jgi:D-beta-D-heptose 7-phosphate kinase/D-beta-D-heptose 1-phosphate adenosyltransferase
MGRIVTLEEARIERERARAGNRRVVFTNGCFDLLHRGHLDLLVQAAGFGDLLIVGVNDDASARRL